MNTDTTDVTASTKAGMMWRFYCEARNQLIELKEKERLYAEAYLAEMRRADIPDVFSSHVLIEAAKDDKNGRYWRKYILERMFGADFLKAHKVKFVGVTGYNAYQMEKAHGYYIELTCEGVTYKFFAPNPQNLTLKDPDYLMPIRFYAHWHKGNAKDEFCSTWNMVNEQENESYDWKKVCDNIKAFIERKVVSQ